MSARDIFRTNPVPRSREAYNANMAKWRYKRELALHPCPCRAIVVYQPPTRALMTLPAPASPAPYMPGRGAEIEDRMYLTQYEWHAGGLKRRLQ